jgi:hypothetical protein
MTTISKDAKLVTFINVFTVEPANQQRLVELQWRTIEDHEAMRKAPAASLAPRRPSHLLLAHY